MSDQTLGWRKMHIDSQPGPKNVQLVVELTDGNVIRLDLSEHAAEHVGAGLIRASGMVASCPRSVIDNA